MEVSGERQKPCKVAFREDRLEPGGTDGFDGLDALPVAEEIAGLIGFVQYPLPGPDDVVRGHRLPITPGKVLKQLEGHRPQIRGQTAVLETGYGHDQVWEETAVRCVSKERLLNQRRGVHAEPDPLEHPEITAGAPGLILGAEARPLERRVLSCHPVHADRVDQEERRRRAHAQCGSAGHKLTPRDRSLMETSVRFGEAIMLPGHSQPPAILLVG